MPRKTKHTAKKAVKFSSQGQEMTNFWSSNDRNIFMGFMSVQDNMCHDHASIQQ